MRVAGSPQVVRVHDLTAKRAYDLEPPADADNWYLRVAPNRTCRFELFERRGARLRRLAVSEEVTTPIRWAGESGEYVPAEIIQAVRHPISRQARARGEDRARDAQGASCGESRRRRRARAAVGHVERRGQRPQAPPPERPAGPPPTPIPVPWEKVFAAAYAGGK